jgi:hypothetical protein
MTTGPITGAITRAITRPVVGFGVEGGAPAFVPSSLYGGSDQGLVLDAVDSSTLWQDTAGTTAITAAGQTIGRWSDISGKGNHVTQATAGSRPTYRTGSPRVEFNGTNNRLFTASTVNMSGSDKCTVIVALATRGTANHGIFSLGGNSAGDLNLGWYSGAGGYRAVNYNGGTEAGAGISALDQPAVPHTRVMTVEVDRSKVTIPRSSRLRIDGNDVTNQDVGTGILTGNLGTRTISIGDWLSVFFLSGDIYRVIVINRLLTESERFSAEKWCGDAAGRTVIYPIPPVGEADVNHLMIYGQSLSLGTQSRPAISTTANSHYAFGGGGTVRFWEGVSYSTASMVSHTERDSSVDLFGETPLYGCYQMVGQLGTYSKQFLASAPGFGATTIADLSSGGYYNRLIESVGVGKKRSRELGKQYKVRAILWMQGESDGGNTSYAANLNSLLGTLNTDIKAITYQTDDIWLISYQVDRAQIGLAHLAASDTYARIRVAMPMYMLAHTDGVHLTAAASKIAGAYFGLAYKAIILDGNTSWQPLRIQSATRSGTTIDVVYNPVGSLALDTTTVSAQTNSGFRLFDSGGSALTISSVSLLNATTVRITAAASVPAGAILRYGFSDPTDHTAAVAKGNLRDSQGASIVFDSSGVNWPMHNWALLEQKTLA